MQPSMSCALMNPRPVQGNPKGNVFHFFPPQHIEIISFPVLTLALLCVVDSYTFYLLKNSCFYSMSSRNRGMSYHPASFIHFVFDVRVCVLTCAHVKVRRKPQVSFLAFCFI